MAKRKLKKKYKKRLKQLILIVLAIAFIFIGAEAAEYYFTSGEKLKPLYQKKEYYNISDFGITRLTSETDYNQNGNDDYTDFLIGEKQYAEFNPKYKSDYYAGGYSPVKKEGVATDLIWYALKNAGYSLKDMIDKDIRKTRGKDIYYIAVMDSNIDFRRVANQDTFFNRYAKKLDTDMYNIGKFMPGDIITFNDAEHIAMISDKYTKEGVPYIIHNISTKQKQKEENILEKTKMKITGHYRFEYTKKIAKLIKS